MTERGSESSESSASHPLVGLLFWMMGKNLQEEASQFAKEDRDNNLTQQEEDIASERIQRRSLSWKDEQPNELLETWHEFVDVKGPDIALTTDGGDPDKSSLKAGTTLSRRPSTLGDEDDEEVKKRCSPNSPNWGFFVAITPPNDLYPSGSSSSTTSKQSTPAVSREVTPKAQDNLNTQHADKVFAATATESQRQSGAEELKSELEVVKSKAEKK